ncbi:DUF3006 domain-containing protein [Peribacillus sp. SCS-26]|uniref:DUF3006 domain-containing protein n=1 Tax=Paraperibacillus marinus TaxID=3115295 RepID=UPI0039062789
MLKIAEILSTFTIEIIIDRFEGEWVFVEVDGVTKDYKKTDFPKNAAIGDVVLINQNSIKVLNEDTDKLRKEVEDLMDDLFEE